MVKEKYKTIAVEKNFFVFSYKKLEINYNSFQFVNTMNDCISILEQSNKHAMIRMWNQKSIKRF